MLPVGTEPVAGTAADLTRGARLGDVDLDTAFTDIDPVDGRFEHRLSARADGRGVTVWADPVFRWVQVFSPVGPSDRECSATRQVRRAEPVTCGINALNTGEGLIWLEPGERPEPGDCRPSAPDGVNRVGRRLGGAHTARWNSDQGWVLRPTWLITSHTQKSASTPRRTLSGGR